MKHYIHIREDSLSKHQPKYPSTLGKVPKPGLHPNSVPGPNKWEIKIKACMEKTSPRGMTASQPHSLDFPLCCESLSHTAHQKASLKSSLSCPGCPVTRTCATLPSRGAGDLVPHPSWHFCPTVLCYRGCEWKGETNWKHGIWNSWAQGVLSSLSCSDHLSCELPMSCQQGRQASFCSTSNYLRGPFFFNIPHLHRQIYMHWQPGLHTHGTIKTFKYMTSNLSYLEHETD